MQIGTSVRVRVDGQVYTASVTRIVSETVVDVVTYNDDVNNRSILFGRPEVTLAETEDQRSLDDRWWIL